MALSGYVKASLAFSEVVSVGLATSTLTTAVAASQRLTDGTAAGQVNVIWSDNRTLAATAEDLVLSSSNDDGLGGNTATFARVKALYVRNTHATATLTIGGSTSAAWVTPFGDVSDKVTIPPGGFVLLTAPGATGYAVTQGTGDHLRVDPGAATITYEIVVLGCSS